MTGLRLLLVEDNLLNQQVACMLLQAEGAAITVAGNGAEALACVTAPGLFDAVLMDMQMPVMDGYEATRRLRALGHTNLPILALTAHVLDDERAACRAAGVNDFIDKPIDFDAMIATVAHHCGRNQSP
ncbi:response regulator [Duganella sp. Leaf126]|uniref:response regulator n=1 Tax=Duganella sp. Leaf126 TaxID=1736266 RepID=UPI001E2AF674|nr:response regulator [Duganella sp. Leaf126]